MTKPKLYHYAISSCSFRVRIAFNVKNIEYEAVVVQPGSRAAEYAKVNPQGLVPFLQAGSKGVAQVSLRIFVDATFARNLHLPHSLLHCACRALTRTRSRSRCASSSSQKRLYLARSSYPAIPREGLGRGELRHTSFRKYSRCRTHGWTSTCTHWLGRLQRFQGSYDM